MSAMHATSLATGLELYDAAAHASASHVIRRYSTSFGWASRLLRPDARRAVADVYALVRVADELVDGPAEAAGVDRAARAALLHDLEEEVAGALERRFSTNLVVHAFAVTARRHGIDMTLCRPFFSSMRADLDTEVYRGAELDRYVHGSAEVVGLMCLAIFEHGRERADAERALLEAGARRLGAAFQHVNFLRDLADDRDRLGRSYVDSAHALSEPEKERVVASVRAHLLAADEAIPLLRSDCRAAVWAARAMFGALADRIDRTSAERLAQERVRVPDVVKLGILARAAGMRAAG